MKNHVVFVWLDVDSMAVQHRVEYDFYPGFSGTREDPPEPPEITILSVKHRLGGDELLPTLTDTQQIELEARLWELHNE